MLYRSQETCVLLVSPLHLFDCLFNPHTPEVASHRPVRVGSHAALDRRSCSQGVKWCDWWWCAPSPCRLCMWFRWGGSVLPFILKTGMIWAYLEAVSSPIFANIDFFAVCVLWKAWLCVCVGGGQPSLNSSAVAELIVEKLCLFFGVCKQFLSVCEWRGSRHFRPSCFDEELLGGGWVCHIVGDQPFHVSPVEAAQTVLDLPFQRYEFLLQVFIFKVFQRL